MYYHYCTTLYLYFLNNPYAAEYEKFKMFMYLFHLHGDSSNTLIKRNILSP